MGPAVRPTFHLIQQRARLSRLNKALSKPCTNTIHHRVLREFARHHETGEPIPEEITKCVHASLPISHDMHAVRKLRPLIKHPHNHHHASALRASKAAFAGVDTQIQILYSLVDQRLFGPQPLPGGHDPLSSEFLGAVQRQVTSLPHAEGSLWHARFGHLTGYGAGYYGYLYDRCVALF